MCLHNEKNEGKQYKYGYKVFAVKDDELYPIKEKQCLKYPFKEGLNKNGEGFHAFINKKDADDMIEFINFLNSGSNVKSFTSHKYITKKVKVNNITKWGYNMTTKKDMEIMLYNDKLPINAFKCKEIEI